MAAAAGGATAAARGGGWGSGGKGRSGGAAWRLGERGSGSGGGNIDSRRPRSLAAPLLASPLLVACRPKRAHRALQYHLRYDVAHT